MNVLEQLRGNYDAAADLWSQYKDRLKDFRSVIKNDVVSLEAAARKTTEATQRLRTAYGEVITLLNSDEMRTAVENAERLAAAMAALAQLQNQKLLFQVTDQS